MSRLKMSWGGLHYREAGDGAPLLLISGLNGLAQPWHRVAQALAMRFRVITHDHRGVGESDTWAGTYSVRQIADDILEMMDKLRIERAHIVGHSLGGAVAQTIAAHHPERVDHLVIVASWAGPETYFCELMQMRKDVLIGMGTGFFLRSGPFGIYPPDWIADHQTAIQEAASQAAQSFPSHQVILSRIDACIEHDQRHHLDRIQAPTLVIGVEDDMTTPAYCSEEIAKGIRQAQLTLLPYGGHNPHVVVPVQVQQLISNFISII